MNRLTKKDHALKCLARLGLFCNATRLHSFPGFASFASFFSLALPMYVPRRVPGASQNGDSFEVVDLVVFRIVGKNAFTVLIKP